MGRNGATWVGLGLVGLSAVLYLVAGPHVAEAPPTVRLATGLGLVALTGLGLGFGWQERAAEPLRQLLLWSACVVAAATLIAYRGEFLGAAGFSAAASSAPAGPAPATAGPGLVTLRAEESGHFFAEALVDGVHVTFLVDTGATDIALSRQDALRLGLDLDALDYKIPVNTANGRTWAALIELRQVAVGSIVVERVSATVPQSELHHSLLGMSFLKRLASFSIDSDRLVMRQ